MEQFGYRLVRFGQPWFDGETLVLDGCKERMIPNVKVGDIVSGYAGRGLRGVPFRSLVFAGRVEETDGYELRFGEYVFYGEDAIELPEDLKPITDVRRNYYRAKNDPYKDAFERFFDSLLKGMQSSPEVAPARKCKPKEVKPEAPKRKC